MLKHPTASEAPQQSQDSSSEKPRFTDDVEDDISEAKEESETGTESIDDVDDRADDEDISE
jgi:hypothetical protein